MAYNVDWEQVESLLKQAMLAAYRASHRKEERHWDDDLPAVLNSNLTKEK